MKFNWIVLLLLLIQFSGYAQPLRERIKVSEDIELIKLSGRAYVHISISDIAGFGKVSSDGLILVDSGQAFLFDTPVTEEQTKTLVKWVADSLHATVTTFVPNHWHEDCMGGLGYLNEQGVKSYANQMTIDIAKSKGLPLPQQGFKDSLSLKLHSIEVDCYYFGEGHTTDNIVTWIPSENILFGGCMVKEMRSKGLGNLSDANVNEWPKTIKKVIDRFPSAEVVIPGHGEIGGKELLLHTSKLLSAKGQ